jgi:hypothetical protein
MLAVALLSSRPKLPNFSCELYRRCTELRLQTSSIIQWRSGQQFLPAQAQSRTGRHTSRFVRLPIMRIKPFRIEEYFAKYEFSAQYLLASSDVESQTIRDVLDLEPGAHEEFLKQWCGYTEVSGAPQLREVIAGIYTRTMWLFFRARKKEFLSFTTPW